MVVDATSNTQGQLQSVPCFQSATSSVRSRGTTGKVAIPHQSLLKHMGPYLGNSPRSPPGWQKRLAMKLLSLELWLLLGRNSGNNKTVLVAPTSHQRTLTKPACSASSKSAFFNALLTEHSKLTGSFNHITVEPSKSLQYV